MSAPVAVTWWGHSSTTVELGAVRIATDPLLTRSLYHLRRIGPLPTAAAVDADVVVVSHLHHDHLHLPSLDRFDPGVPVVVPRGAARHVRGLARRALVEVAPGERVDVAGVAVEVLPAHHPTARSAWERRAGAPPLGFRMATADAAVWFPGDTGWRADFADVEPVDLALVPIGGWGPSLGGDHLDPDEAARAVAAVGARWALAVHYGTFWPIGSRRLRPRAHRHLFLTPAERFRAAMTDVDATTLTPGFGERVVLRGPGGFEAPR